MWHELEGLVGETGAVQVVGEKPNDPATMPMARNAAAATPERPGPAKFCGPALVTSMDGHSLRPAHRLGLCVLGSRVLVPSPLGEPTAPGFKSGAVWPVKGSDWCNGARNLYGDKAHAQAAYQPSGVSGHHSSGLERCLGVSPDPVETRTSSNLIARTTKGDRDVVTHGYGASFYLIASC